MTDQPEDEVLPCGCHLVFAVEDGVRVMKITPCRQTCRHYLTAIGMARDAGTPVEFRELP